MGLGELTERERDEPLKNARGGQGAKKEEQFPTTVKEVFSVEQTRREPEAV